VLVVDVLEQGSERGMTRRRWPWLLGALVVIAGLLAGPAWSAWDRHQRQEIARGWALRAAFDDGRAEALAKLAVRAVPGDEGPYSAAVRALDQEEAARLQVLLRQLPHVLLRGSTSTIRDAVGAAIQAERDSLRHPAPANVGEQPLPTADPQALHLADRASRLLSGVKVHVPAQPARAADATIARFSHFLDQPVGPLRLLVYTDTGLRWLDVDDSHEEPGPAYDMPNSDTLPGADVVARPGWLALGGPVMRTFDEDGSSYPLPLGPFAVAGPTPSTVWTSDMRQAVLSDRQGQRLQGPVTLPTDTERLVGALGNELVLLLRDRSDPARLVEWDTITHAEDGLASDVCRYPLDLQGSLLAWRSCDDPVSTLQLSNLPRGATRTVTLPAGWTAATAGFSPDGKRLAVWLYSYQQDGTRLLIIDATTGRGREPSLPVNRGRATPFVWSPDSAKVFIGYTTGAQQRIAAVDAATGAAEVLRYRAGGLQPLAALPR
jgi:hypothetical protein